MDPEQKAWLAGVFDRAAPAYDRVGVAYHEHFGRRLVELAGLPADAALLDVGCGRAAVLLAAAGRVGTLTGVDVSAGMLDHARAELRAAGVDGVRLEVMDAERLAFADGTFDALTAAFLLFFLPDPERAAAEFRRVLRPGGRVAVSTWGDDDPRWAWEDDLMAGLRVDRRAIQRPFARPAEVHDLLAGAGFTDVTTHREELEIRLRRRGPVVGVALVVQPAWRAGAARRRGGGVAAGAGHRPVPGGRARGRPPDAAHRLGGHCAPAVRGALPPQRRRDRWRILFIASSAATLYASASVG